jgi:hypothetical protein
VEGLITLDDCGRMVSTDREALAQAITDLLDGPLDQPAVLRRAGTGLLVLGRHAEAISLRALRRPGHCWRRRCGSGVPRARGTFPHRRYADRAAAG